LIDQALTSDDAGWVEGAGA